jgi:hypothetical protein
MESEDLKEMLRDLIWLDALIATELIQVTENTSSILRGAPPPAACLKQHAALRKFALELAEKYRELPALREHIAGHG